MIGLALVISQLIAGQYPPIVLPQKIAPPPGVEDHTVYEIVLEGHKDSIFGYVKESGGAVFIYPDTPWKPSPRIGPKLPSMIESKNPEGDARRKSRLKREFKKAGYVAVDSYWVKADQVKASKRAHAMARKELDGAVTPTPKAVAPAGKKPSGPAPNPIQRWGLHAVILLVGVALAGVVIKTMILQR